MKDILWAPWRLEYILSDKKESGCILCNVQKSRLFVLFEGQSFFIVLNSFPYNSGHIMVCPKRHISSFEEMNDAELFEGSQLLQKSIGVLKKVLSPMGFNLGLNQGSVAGAGIDDHLHYHVVPRWSGDTNFMPIIGNTKVVSNYLQQAYETLQPEFQKKGIQS